MTRAHRLLGDTVTAPLGTVVIEGFASRLAFGIISFALPLYAYSLGMPLSTIGVLLSLNLFVALLLKPVVGLLIDRIGVRRAYLAAVILRSVALLLLTVSFVPWHLFAVRSVHGIAIALRDPAAASVLAGLGGTRAVAQRFAWYQTAKTVAGALGRLLAGALITLLSGDYTWVFLAAAVLSFLPLVLVLTRLHGADLDHLVGPSAGSPPSPGGHWRRLGPAAGLGFLVAGTAHLMTNLLPIFAVEYVGVSAAAAGGLYAITALAGLSGPIWGWLADHGNRRLVLATRAIGNIASSAVWLASPTYAGLVTGKTIDDIGKAAFQPAWGATMAHTAAHNPTRRATTLAQLSAAEDLGEATGPVVAGLIWSLWGIPTLLATRILLAGITEAYAWSMRNNLDLTTPAAEGARPPPVQPHRRGGLSGRHRSRT